MAKSVNEVLRDLLLQHQHYILATEQSVMRKMEKPIRRALSEVRGVLNRNGYTPTDWKTARYKAAEKELEELFQLSVASSNQNLQEELLKVIQAENVASTRIFKEALPLPVDQMVEFVPIDIDQARHWIQEPLGGATLDGRFKTLASGTVQDAHDALGVAVMLGESTAQAARRIRQYVAGNTMWKARRIARTEVHRNAIRTQREVWDRHEIILNGLQYTATLDNRTCEVCGADDGAVFWYDKSQSPNVSSAPYIPRHSNCRCMYLPSTKTWQQLGFTKQDLKGNPALRALDAPAAQPLTYGAWFKQQPVEIQKQILGPKKYKAYKAGKLKFRSMVQAAPKNLKPLAPKKLRDLLGLGKAAFPKKQVKGAPLPRKKSSKKKPPAATRREELAKVMLDAQALRKIYVDALVHFTDRKTGAAFLREVRQQRKMLATRVGTSTPRIDLQKMYKSVIHQYWKGMQDISSYSRQSTEALKLAAQVVAKVQRDLGKSYEAFLIELGLDKGLSPAEFQTVLAVYHPTSGQATDATIQAAKRLTELLKKHRGLRQDLMILGKVAQKQGRKVGIHAAGLRHRGINGFSCVVKDASTRRRLVAKEYSGVSPAMVAQGVGVDTAKVTGTIAPDYYAVVDAQLIEAPTRVTVAGLKELESSLLHEVGHAAQGYANPRGMVSGFAPVADRHKPLVKLLQSRAKRYGVHTPGTVAGANHGWVRGPWTTSYAGRTYVNCPAWMVQGIADKDERILKKFFAKTQVDGELFSVGAERLPGFRELIQAGSKKGGPVKRLSGRAARVLGTTIIDPEYTAAWFQALKLALEGK